MKNELITRTVGEIAAEVPAAIRVFERLHIDYCCGGATPIAAACQNAGITVGEFFDELERSAPSPATLDYAHCTLAEMSKSIVDTFHVHAREELDTLRMLAAKVVSVHAERHPELRKVAVLVQALEQDMLPHMIKEEQILFPYVDQLEADNYVSSSCFGSVANPIRVMNAEHESVGEILRQLRETSFEYAVPLDACFSYNQLYQRLEAFEKETHEHIHLENNVYFPRALQLEQSVVA